MFVQLTNGVEILEHGKEVIDGKTPPERYCASAICTVGVGVEV